MSDTIKQVATIASIIFGGAGFTFGLGAAITKGDIQRVEAKSEAQYSGLEKQLDLMRSDVRETKEMVKNVANAVERLERRRDDDQTRRIR